jgi:hypothetical protein
LTFVYSAAANHLLKSKVYFSLSNHGNDATLLRAFLVMVDVASTSQDFDTAIIGFVLDCHHGSLLP